MPQYRPEIQPVRRREPLGYNLWQEDKESAPVFTFLLRPRVMQVRQTCKLLCCLSGKPLPTVSFTWLSNLLSVCILHGPSTCWNPWSWKWWGLIECSSIIFLFRACVSRFLNYLCCVPLCVYPFSIFIASIISIFFKCLRLSNSVTNSTAALILLNHFLYTGCIWPLLL